jgi:hypothetical protein
MFHQFNEEKKLCSKGYFPSFLLEQCFGNIKLFGIITTSNEEMNYEKTIALHTHTKQKR